MTNTYFLNDSVPSIMTATSANMETNAMAAFDTETSITTFKNTHRSFSETSV